VVWLGLITVNYLRATEPFLRQALQRGEGKLILLGLIGLGIAGFVGGLRKVQFSVAYLVFLMFGFLIACVAFLGLGGNFLAVMAAVWLFIVAWIWGDWVLKRLFRSSGPTGVLRGVLATLLGCGLISHAVLALALAGLLYRWLIVALLLLALLPAWQYRSSIGQSFRLLRPRFDTLIDTSHHWLALPIATLLVGWCLILFIQALAPETQYDALLYHLGLPKLYIEQGRYVVTPFSMQSWFYLGADMNFLAAMSLAGQTAAKLMQTGFLILVIALVYDFGRQALSHRAGLLAAILMLTTPLVAWEGTTAYVDIILTGYCLGSVVAVWGWLRDRHLGWLVLAGLLGGFATSVKISALYILLPLGIIILATQLQVFMSTKRLSLVPAIVFGGAFGLAGWPWPLLRWWQTGNPIFPFYNDFFGSPLWPPGEPPPIFTTFGIGYELTAILRLPWALTFETAKFHEGFSVVVGVGLLVLPLVIVPLAQSHQGARAALYLLGVLIPFSVFWVFNAHQYLRFALPIWPLVCLLAGYGLACLRLPEPAWLQQRSISLSRAIPLALAIVWTIFSVPMLLRMSWNIPERIPVDVVLGRESREAYLSRLLVTYDAYRVLEAKYPGNTTNTISVSDETRLYAPGTIQPLHSPLLRDLLLANTAEEAMEVIRQRGITHLLINRNGIPATLSGFFLIQKSFLDTHAELEYAGKNVYLYRFLPATGEP
jgi:hypothetical protein